jgi:hypothetical protein
VAARTSLEPAAVDLVSIRNKDAQQPGIALPVALVQRIPGRSPHEALALAR